MNKPKPCSSCLVFIMFVFLISANAATHVRDYTRKDGTHVSGYDRSSPSDNFSFSDNPAIYLVIAGVLFGAILIYAIVSKQNEQERAKNLAAKSQTMTAFAQLWLAQLTSGNFTPPETSIIMRDGECVLLHEQCSLIEAKASRLYGGLGTTVHGIRVGGGTSTSVDQLKQIDSGTLTLTNKRLIFDGQMQNRILEVRHIVSAKPWADAVEIDSEKKAKNQLYTISNPVLWATVVSMVAKGQVNVSQKA